MGDGPVTDTNRTSKTKANNKVTLSIFTPPQVSLNTWVCRPDEGLEQPSQHTHAYSSHSCTKDRFLLRLRKQSRDCVRCRSLGNLFPTPPVQSTRSSSTYWRAPGLVRGDFSVGGPPGPGSTASPADQAPARRLLGWCGSYSPPYYPASFFRPHRSPAGRGTSVRRRPSQSGTATPP